MLTFYLSLSLGLTCIFIHFSTIEVLKYCFFFYIFTDCNEKQRKEICTYYLYFSVYCKFFFLLISRIIFFFSDISSKTMTHNWLSTVVISTHFASANFVRIFLETKKGQFKRRNETEFPRLFHLALEIWFV